MSQTAVPISHGELIDKITILEIKSERIGDTAKLASCEYEQCTNCTYTNGSCP